MITCVGPTYWAQTELIGHRDEVDCYEREVVGHEGPPCPPRVVVVVVSCVAQDDHTETHAQS